MYWFEMIELSKKENKIVDQAEAAHPNTKANMSVDDWTLHCIQEIKGNMLLLNKTWKRIID